MNRKSLRTAITTTLLGSLGFLGYQVSMDNHRVAGRSMEDEIHDNDKVYSLKKEFCSIDRGDIIVFKKSSETLVKRVINLPGDRVHPCEKHWDNQEECEMPYFYELKEDEYFVLGDNRDISIDSREFGPIGYDNIVGKVVHTNHAFHNPSSAYAKNK